MECPRCRSICSDKAARCPHCFTDIIHPPFLRVELIIREGIALLGFTVLWIIVYLRNHYVFIKYGIPANRENEMLYALGTTIIAYILYWIIRVIIWRIGAKKEIAPYEAGKFGKFYIL